MPRYFFHVRYGDGSDEVAVDQEGDDLADPTAARAHALGIARDLIARTRMSTIRDWFACSFEVEDADGRHLFTVPFSETLPDSAFDHGPDDSA